MKSILLLLCLNIGLYTTNADAPTVPNSIRFAGLNLKLTEKARKKIQAEVNALTKNPRYFQIKVDRLQMYFPIIERVFNEEGLPDDFKYLVLQESALISDAVSSSNAVGFWQFKKAAAVEVGLRIDRNVDERLNIVSSTRGAAKYIKKNNRLYFDNWVHALLAYQQGPGGALKLVNKKYRGSRSMPISGNTHWYVIKFLAHKIAFEQVKSRDPQLYLVEFYKGQGKTLKGISDHNHMDDQLVQKYNKWLKRGKVPGDKPYAVILPYEKNPEFLASSNSQKSKPSAPSQPVRQAPSAQHYRTHSSKYPMVKTYKNGNRGIKINGIRGVRLKQDMALSALESVTGVSIKRLLYYNDVSPAKRPRKGELWYLRSKRNKAMEEYHIVTERENLWSVSQKYGIRLSKLRSKNRISNRQTTVRVGRVLWLQETRPPDVPVAYISDELPENKAPTEYSPQSEPQLEQKQLETLETLAVRDSEKLTKPVQKVHVVNAGETLYSISRKYGLTTEDLRGLNNLEESPVLSIGQQLYISEAEQLQNHQTAPSEVVEAGLLFHQVKPGETLYQIAREYNATIKQLMEWNNKSDFNLRVGEELKVHKTR